MKITVFQDLKPCSPSTKLYDLGHIYNVVSGAAMLGNRAQGAAK
jgi:hypothetical protein